MPKAKLFKTLNWTHFFWNLLDWSWAAKSHSSALLENVQGVENCLN